MPDEKLWGKVREWLRQDRQRSIRISSGRTWDIVGWHIYDRTVLVSAVSGHTLNAALCGFLKAAGGRK